MAMGFICFHSYACSLFSHLDMQPSTSDSEHGAQS